MTTWFGAHSPHSQVSDRGFKFSSPRVSPVTVAQLVSAGGSYGDATCSPDGTKSKPKWLIYCLIALVRAYTCAVLSTCLD
jgi:hypothetical protein